MSDNIQTNTTGRLTPCLQKKIDKMTYLVEVHFSDTSTQNVEDKLRRVILHDLEHGKQGKPQKSSYCFKSIRYDFRVLEFRCLRYLQYSIYSVIWSFKVFIVRQSPCFLYYYGCLTAACPSDSGDRALGIIRIMLLTCRGKWQIIEAGSISPAHRGYVALCCGGFESELYSRLELED